VIGFIVFGLVVGVIARIIVPGRQHIGILLTVLLGIVGSIVGGIIAGWLGTGDVFELNFLGACVAIATAALLILAVDGPHTRRRRRSRRSS
jgi:uncharacterized membrane protein YeaQ/YmgE (transglycosylase-associated protein family)